MEFVSRDYGWSFIFILDFLRILFMGLYLINMFFFPGEDYAQARVYSFVNFFSWIGLLKYFRRLSGVRGFITLIIKAFSEMKYFLVIVILFIIALTTSLRIKADHSEKSSHFGGINFGQGLVHQYRFVFADFEKWDDYNNNSPLTVDTTDYIFMLFTTLFVTLILFNLIVAIFTDVYADLKQIKLAEDLRTLNEVLMDVEYFVSTITCRKRYNEPCRAHLAYAEYQHQVRDYEEHEVKTELNLIKQKQVTLEA